MNIKHFIANFLIVILAIGLVTAIPLDIKNYFEDITNSFGLLDYSLNSTTLRLPDLPEVKYIWVITVSALMMLTSLVFTSIMNSSNPDDRVYIKMSNMLTIAGTAVAIFIGTLNMLDIELVINHYILFIVSIYILTGLFIITFEHNNKAQWFLIAVLTIMSGFSYKFHEDYISKVAITLEKDKMTISKNMENIKKYQENIKKKEEKEKEELKTLIESLKKSQ